MKKTEPEITLRDFFAAAVIAGIFAGKWGQIPNQKPEVLKILKDDAVRTYDNYEKMLNERFDGTIIDEKKSGLARELARMNLTLKLVS